MTETMTETWTNLARTQPIAVAAIAVAAGGAATILGAWFFQYGLGLKPCPLCLEQRYPYYFGIPLAVLLALGTTVGSSRKVLLAGLFVIAIGMLWNAGLATYHAGVEWKFWPGPQECSGSFESSGGRRRMWTIDADLIVTSRARAASRRMAAQGLYGSRRRWRASSP